MTPPLPTHPLTHRPLLFKEWCPQRLSPPLPSSLSVHPLPLTPQFWSDIRYGADAPTITSFSPWLLPYLLCPPSRSRAWAVVSVAFRAITPSHQTSLGGMTLFKSRCVVTIVRRVSGMVTLTGAMASPFDGFLNTTRLCFRLPLSHW